MTKLTDQNLSVADPSRWVELLFYDHPPYTKRVDLARRYKSRPSLRAKRSHPMPTDTPPRLPHPDVIGTRNDDKHKEASD